MEGIKTMTQDEYGEVLNSEETFKEIGEGIKQGHTYFIGWTDGLGSHYDILFCRPTQDAGTFQGGIKTVHYLFVSVMRVGAFAFREDQLDTKADYYGEKLGLGENETVDRLAELINGIKKYL